MDDFMDSVDLSWLDKYIRTTEGGVTYLPEIMSNIKLKILYINTNNEIEHIIKKDVPLEVNTQESFINESTLIKFIHNYRDYNKKRYQCDGILKYFISMDPQTIFENIHNDNFTFSDENSFFHFELPCTIHFPPSLFIFHSINTIYIIFRELLLVETKMDSITIKKNNNSITKRLRIGESINLNRKTRKR